MNRNLDDWLTTYIQFTQNTEPSRMYHLWTGIMAISTCLQRKIWLPWGHDNIYPNMYVALVGPPGGRKGTALKIAKKMCQQISAPMSSDCVTIQQLYQEIEQAEDTYRTHDGIILTHKSLAIWSDEFSVFLGNQNVDMIVALTDLFDAPDTWRYSTKGKGTNDLSNCYLTILGAITPKVLQSRLTQDVTGGGLLSRIIFVVAYGKEKFVALPFLSADDYKLYDSLIQDLEVIKNLTGTFQFTEEAMEAYIEWYNDPRNTAIMDDDKFIGYNNRRALHVRKLCMIVSVSESDNLIVTQTHFDKAVTILEKTEQDMPNAFFGLGRANHAQTLSELNQVFATAKTLTWTQLLERFQLDVMPADLTALLQIMETTGRIKKEQSMSGQVSYSLFEMSTSHENTLDIVDKTYFKNLPAKSVF